MLNKQHLPIKVQDVFECRTVSSMASLITSRLKDPTQQQKQVRGGVMVGEFLMKFTHQEERNSGKPLSTVVVVLPPSRGFFVICESLAILLSQQHDVILVRPAMQRPHSGETLVWSLEKTARNLVEQFDLSKHLVVSLIGFSGGALFLPLLYRWLLNTEPRLRDMLNPVSALLDSRPAFPKAHPDFYQAMLFSYFSPKLPKEVMVTLQQLPRDQLAAMPESAKLTLVYQKCGLDISGELSKPDVKSDFDDWEWFFGEVSIFPHDSVIKYQDCMNKFVFISSEENNDVLTCVHHFEKYGVPVESTPVQGSHFGMLQEPHVSLLHDKLKTILHLE
eukprot:TRINITY_DN373_c0_g1_i5.p1 TRINITY_DN373_c0_g1~~TRINITY_DN373_c0_g1_i5.p1  ORF type:complete len:333 (+),score=61.70 TRINITY_DN373_c0_g1_i5:299-1297(+)